MRFFRISKKLLLIGETPSISSAEAERAASGIRKLKTAFRNTMKGVPENNLNLLQVHTTGNINVKEILQIFIKKTQEDCFHHLKFLVKPIKIYITFTLSFDLLYLK